MHDMMQWPNFFSVFLFNILTKNKKLNALPHCNACPCYYILFPHLYEMMMIIIIIIIIIIFNMQ